MLDKAKDKGIVDHYGAMHELTLPLTLTLTLTLTPQEYGPSCPEPNRNRVYISYLDSVRYFDPSPASAPGSEPAGHRSTVYHSMLVAYLQWTRMLGFKHVHIWVEPKTLEP